ncbi:phage tail tape measure protein [Psychrobacillus antarcticus]|uniref:phage tail tape measure protein n=1 Tax=Psychrobacillus antarcticus TaxID=2879115 RepID=UPI00240798AC|nr:phage tail tape measure protein [Psychrobacillus antarcticus]
MTTEIGSLAVSLSMDASNFNGSINQMNRHLGAMGSELRAAKALGAEYGKSIDGLTSKKEILTRSVGTSTVKLEAERRKYDELVASGTANEAQLERQARRVNEAQAAHNRLSTELNQVTEQLRIQSSAWTQNGERMQAFGGQLSSVGDKATKIGKNLSMHVTAPLMAMGGAAFKAAVDFESAFAGVRKTVDGTEAEFQVLSDGIRDMAKEIPAAATEIAGVAEAAGQLGIQKESILGFTRTMTDLGVATNMSSEEAATALARLANITGMNQKDFDRLGSSVVALGNNFATTEKEIVEMGLRLAGAGAQVGMSEADILGLSTALTSVGINAEMGGSAFSRVMVSMQLATSTGFTKVQKLSNETGLSLRDLQMMASHSGKAFGNMAEDMGMTKKELKAIVNAGVELEGFSKIAGMTGEQFKQAFEKDAVGAIGSFIDGLANAEDSGDTAINMLQEMGITSVLLRDSLLRAGGASELFGSAIKVSNAGWDENIALTKEAEERYKTTASQIKILWNDIKDLGMEFGGVLIPIVKDGINTIKPWISSLAQASDGTKKMALTFGVLAAAVGPVLVVGGTLLSGLGGLITTVGALSTSIGVAGGLGASLLALANPIGLTVAGLAAVTIGAVALYRHLDQKGLPQIDIFGDKVSDSTKKAVTGFVELNDKATVELNKLSWGGMVVTQDMANTIIQTFDAMGDQVLAKMTEDHSAQLTQLKNYSAQSSILTDEQEQEAISRLEAFNAEKEKKTEETNARVAEIVNKAVEENRKTTYEENATIKMLQQERFEAGLQILSQSELEFKTIMERMKAQSAEITAEQAIQTIDDARKTKTDVINEAEKQYEDTIAFIIKMRDEVGVYTGEQARQMILEAQTQKDGVVAEADEMYSEVLRIAKEKGGEHLTENEIMLGKQLSLWDEWSIDITKTAAITYLKVNGSFKNMAINGAISLGELRQKGSEAFIGMHRSIDYVMGDLPKLMKRKMAEALAELTIRVIGFTNVGRDLVQGLINGMKEKANEIIIASREIGTSIITTVSRVLQRRSPSRVMFAIGQDTSMGLALGIKDKENEVTAKAAQVSKSLIASAKNVLSKGTKETNAEIAVINKKANEEAMKIEKRANEDIHQIKKTAKEKKRKLTSAELLKIQRLEQDSSTKVKKINERAASDVSKINSKSGKERLDALKLFVEEKKQTEQLALVDEVKIWESSISSFKKGTKEKVEAQKSYQKALKAIDNEILSTNKEYTDKMKSINDDYNNSVQDLLDKYNSMVDSRANSLRSFSGLFEEFTYVVEKSGSDLLMNLNSQVEGFRTWQTEMDKFASKRVDSGLIEELREMGPKALPELLALNSLTDEHLTIYSNLYKDKTALARTQAEKELSGMKKDTEASITELRNVANTELEKLRLEWVNKIKLITKSSDDELKSLKTIGENAGKGLLEGLASMEPALTAKARSIANSIQAAMKSALQVKSPSRVTMGIGRHIGEGLVLGMEQMHATVEKTAMHLARFATPSVDDQSYGASVNNRNGKNNVHSQNDRPIIIQPAPVIMDGRTVGEIVFETINNLQYSQTSISAMMKGVSL